MESLNELFETALRDIYYAENAILKALPKMAEKVTSGNLAEAFNTHVEETQGQVERLEQVFEMIGSKPQGKKCPAIEGLITEGEEIMKEAKNSIVCDAGLLAAAQAVEHYEIARYGTLVAWAKKLGLEDAADILQETLDEESATDDKLTELAEEINADFEEDEADEEEGSSRGRAA